MNAPNAKTNSAGKLALVRQGPLRAPRRTASDGLPDMTMFGDIEEPPLLPEATMARARAHYMASASYAALADSTKKMQAQLWKKLLATFGGCKVVDMNPEWIHAYHKARTRQARRVADMELVELATLLSYCARHGVIRSNPAREVRANGAKPRDRYVSDAELSDFLTHCDPWLRSYVALKCATGVRQGQLLALKWSAWDGTDLLVPAAKGGRTTAYHGQAVVDALRAIMSAMHDRPWRDADTMRGVHIIVSPKRRTPYLPPNAHRSFYNVWRRAMLAHEAAGGQRFHEHDLRAKVASDAGSVDRARDLLGHQTTAITDRVYRRRERRVEAHNNAAQLDLFDAAGNPRATCQPLGD